MSNPYFQFKKFVVYHDRCAMKVGTDGVLLGAWTQVCGANDILDIGTGTGLIALMAAQRNQHAAITAVEIERDAASQALENVRRSSWHDRIRVVHADIRAYAPEVKFDLIVSNPPYFERSLTCSAEGRTKARHTAALDYEELLCRASLLLKDGGDFSIVIPADAANRLVALAAGKGLFLSRRTWVRTLPAMPPKRALMAFRKQPAPVEENTLTIEMAHHAYTEEYRALTEDFYLFM